MNDRHVISHQLTGLIDDYKLYTPEKMFVDTYITFLVLKVSLNSTINKNKHILLIYQSITLSRKQLSIRYTKPA